MELINGVNYVSDVSKITEVLFVIIWCLLLVCICYLSIRNMILRSSDEEDSSQKKKRKLNILKIIATIGFAAAFVYGAFVYNDLSDKYIVTISSEVNMDEFLNTYEIVKYDDDDRTFTIKVREQYPHKV